MLKFSPLSTYNNLPILFRLLVSIPSSSPSVNMGFLSRFSRSATPTNDDHSLESDKKQEVSDSEVAAVGEYRTSDSRRQLGTVSVAFLVFNRMVGTGIFATPSSILALSGSVGLALFIWVIGMLIAAAGMATYLEWGTGLPRNGGEKNYLEYVYKKPKFLVTAMYAAYVVLLGWAGSNSVVFGEYILHAAQVDVNRWNQRGIGLACITAAFLIHGTSLKWGLRLQNFLGVIKLLILLIIVISGFVSAPFSACERLVNFLAQVALGGHLQIEKPDNFTNAFEGTTGSAYGVVTALYNVIWSYIGYSNANYALSETKNPVRTLKRAAPAGLILVSILYMLVNVSLCQGSEACIWVDNVCRSHTLQQYRKRISSALGESSLPCSSATCSVYALNVPSLSSWLFPHSETCSV